MPAAILEGEDRRSGASGSVRESAPVSGRPAVAFIFTHRIQYFVNVLDELAAGGRIRPVAVYQHNTASMQDRGFGRMIDWDNRPESSFEEILLNAENSNESGPAGEKRSLSSALTALNPAAVHLNGFAKPIQWKALLWARRRQVPALLRGDGDMLSGNGPSAASIRSAAARFFTSRADHVFFQGEQNRKYWLARGADPKRMSWVPCVSDTKVFHSPAFPTPAARREFRAANGVGGDELVFVVSGKLDARKRPADGLRALELLTKAGSPNNLSRIWFIGSGKLESDLKGIAAALGLAGRVRFWGFQNQRDLPRILQAADVLMHLSEADPWPYSVLDGASSGLALLLSDRTGSYPDWLMAPTAADIFPCGDIARLAACMERFIREPDHLSRLQAAAKARSRFYTEAVFRSAFESAVLPILRSAK